MIPWKCRRAGVPALHADRRCEAQDPNEAEYDGMPQSAIGTGLIDLVLPLARIYSRKHEGKPMELILPLWLPILLSAAIVWIVSAIVWMALPHHKNDFIALPDEDAFIEFLRKSGIRPGNYVFPDFRGREAMKSEKTCKTLETGPVGHLSLWQTPVTMGGKMFATFIVYLAVSTLIAYLTRVALPGAAPFAKVFQIAGTAGVLTYCFSFIPNGVWFGAYKRTLVASFIDGIVYGCVTGAIFAWFWQH